MKYVTSVLQYTLGKLPVSEERIAEAASDATKHYLLHTALEHLDRKDIDPINAYRNSGTNDLFLIN